MNVLDGTLPFFYSGCLGQGHVSRVLTPPLFTSLWSSSYQTGSRPPRWLGGRRSLLPGMSPHCRSAPPSRPGPHTSPGCGHTQGTQGAVSLWRVDGRGSARILGQVGLLEGDGVVETLLGLDVVPGTHVEGPVVQPMGGLRRPPDQPLKEHERSTTMNTKDYY